MNGWQEIKLGDVATITAGGDAPKNAFSKTKTDVFAIPIYSNGITDKGLYGYTNKATIIKPATTISARGTIGAVFRRTEPYLPIVRLISVIGNEEIVDSDFLYYALCNQRIEGDGSVQAQLTVPMISNYYISIPSLQTQKRIARILSSLDDKIEVNNQINRNLEEQAKAIFKSWFVYFEPFQNGEFINSDLGRIPKGWKTGKFTDVVQILGGGTPKTSIPEYWNGMIPFFTPKDVGDSIYTFTTEKNLTEEGLNNCNSRLYPENTVFVTARGTVGKLALAGVPMAMNQSCYALIGKENMPPLYVFCLALQVVETLKKIANGAVFDAIVTRDFETKKIIIPPKEAINRFVELIAPLFKMIHSNGIQNTSLVQSRDTLLPKLMSGEINVFKEIVNV